MQFPVIKYLFTNKTTDALFWVLVHSLWQGLLLAIFAGLILIVTKRSAALLRYNLLCGILILFIAGSLLTFYYGIKLTAGSSDAATTKIIPSAAGYIVPANITDAKHEVNIIESFFSFIRSNENFIVLAWFLIIGFRCVRLLTGLRSIYILKSRQTFDAGEYWNTRLKELAGRIGVRKTVVLLRSAIAKVPMVAGHLKPVILFPAAILTELPQEEIEAILLHELAHIRRKDYLVNMLQSFTEIIFFFNPAVLWISSLIRDERENCCDDIAIGEVKNKKQFIHALVSFQEYNLAPSGYATSFPGRKYQLLNRVKRIITNNNKTLNNMEKIFLASGIIISVFILSAFSHTRQQPSVQKETVAQLTKPVVPFNRTDTIPLREKNESKSTINTSIDGKQYRIVEINGKVTELYVNNERIPDDKISEYKPTIDKIHQQVKADAEKQADQMKLQQKEMMKQSELMKQKQLLMKEQMEKQSEQMKLQQKELMAQADIMKTKEQLVMKQQMEMQAEQMKLQQKELMVQSQLMKQKEQLMKAEMETQAEQMKLHQKEIMAQSELMKQKETLMKKEMEQQSELMKTKKEELLKQMEQLKTQQQLIEKKIMDSVNQSKPAPPKGVIKPVVPNSITKEIVQDLKNENLVTDAEDLSFNLTNDQLTVNGTRQPEQVFQKLKAKYIKNPNDHIFYSSTKGSSHSDISFTTVDN